jgi:quercetin dioxygenase-like cupin family protein
MLKVSNGDDNLAYLLRDSAHRPPKIPETGAFGARQPKEPAMAITHAKPGEVVDARSLGSALASAQTKTLIRAEQVEVIRLIVPAGKEIAEHKAKGEIIVHCLEGRVAFAAFGKTQNLEAGNLLYLPTGEPHTVKGIENASLLLTILLPRH